MSITSYFHARDYYTELLAKIDTATSSIDMMYLAYVDGRWARQINKILVTKVQQGVRVRLLVDTLGTFFEHLRLSPRTFKMFSHLSRQGIEVHYFRHTTNLFRCQHIKLCLIDNRQLLFGGSNIADHYLRWGDNNFSLDSQIPSGVATIFDSIISGQIDPLLTRLPSPLFSSTPAMALTIPGTVHQFETSFFELIRRSTKYLRIQTWYFWPTSKICEALVAAVARGVKVEITISQKNRVPIVNLINYSIIKNLRRQGVLIYKWDRYYSHKKSYWNDRGDILVGSANLDPFSLYNNWEMVLAINDPNLVERLDKNFVSDLSTIHDRRQS